MVTLQFIILTDNVYRKKRFVLDYIRNCKQYQDLGNASEDLTMAMRECGLFSSQYRNMASDYKQSELAYSLYLKFRLREASRHQQKRLRRLSRIHKKSLAPYSVAQQL